MYAHTRTHMHAGSHNTYVYNNTYNINIIYF